MDDVHLTLAVANVDDVPRILAAADAASAGHDAPIVLLDPDAVYGRRHLESAVRHARRAFDQGTATARTLGAEILLYAAGERQVKEAIRRAGIRARLQRVVVLALGDRAGEASRDLLTRLAWREDPLGLPPENPRALERHGVSPSARNPEGAILERVALVDLRK